MLYFARCSQIPSFKSALRDAVLAEEKLEWDSLRKLDPQALSSIHTRFYPDVLRLATYRVGDRMVAEDLASETFIQLINALHAGKGPTKNIRGWLLGTTNNLVNNHFRSTYRSTFDHLGDQDALIDEPVSRLDTYLDDHDRLKSALSNLTEEQQMVISLRFGAEMSLDETARVMGKKPNAIKALQFRATNALRKQLENPSND